MTRVDSGFKKVIQEEQQVCVCEVMMLSVKYVNQFLSLVYNTCSLLLLTSGTVYSYGKCSKIHCEFIAFDKWYGILIW